MKNFKLLSILFLSAILIFSCKKDDDESGTYYVFEQLGDISVESNREINILFQLRNKEGIGVAGKTSADFIVTEDNTEMGAEAKITITPTDQVDIKVKTILLLDNSGSVETNLPDIKEAAIALINNMPNYQQIAIYTFAENVNLIQNLTNNKNALTAAINDIEIGTGGTNLYGAIVTAADRDIWNEHYSIDSIRAANLICFTDGKHTTGNEYTKEQAVTALSDKKAYMLGLGSELDEPILKELGEFRLAENINKLENVFLEIQSDIENTANSFYWLYYTSPKSPGDYTYTLNFNIEGNSNKTSTGYIETEFSTANFVK